VNNYDPIELLFGGMEKLGPGGNTHTLHVLHLLPKQRFNVIVDAGCGTGRQTLVLARELDTPIHAVDSYQPFLNDLLRRAAVAGNQHLVQVHCMDMNDIAGIFHDIELLWSEGAAYNIGFSNALAAWAPALNPEGFAVISELSWLRDRIPESVKEFFLSGYPDMHTVEQNVVVAENPRLQSARHLHAPRRGMGGGLLRRSQAAREGPCRSSGPFRPGSCPRNRQRDRHLRTLRRQLRVRLLSAPTRLTSASRRPGTRADRSAAPLNAHNNTMVVTP
jgi:SAM-dependent methyltransferase